MNNYIKSTTTEAVLNRVQWVRDAMGQNTALGFRGTPEDIQGVFLLLSNSGACTGELQDLGDAEFAYCWVQPREFAWYLAKWEVANAAEQGRFIGRDKIGATRAFYASALKWQRRLQNTTMEPFVPIVRTEREPENAHEIGVEDGIFSPIANETPVPVSEDADEELSEIIALCQK